MIFASLFSIVFGVILGTVLVVTAKDGLHPNRFINIVLDKVTDIIRSFPVLILIVSLNPITRKVVGTTIGPTAAIFAISIACIPYAMRMTENSLQVVDKQVIRAAKSFGASKFQIIYKVMFVEAFPTLISNMTVLVINLLNTTALAGAVGAGGLGAVALAYGYQRFDDAIMYFIVFILLIFVIFIQGFGKKLSKMLK
jgi:D-methionine transport system permease protein